MNNLYQLKRTYSIRMPINHTQLKNDSRSGFALLLTLIIVTVLITIGLSVLDLSIRQVRLSTDSRDSEVAFHAANAGLECALYWRRFEADDMESGQAVNPTCFGVSPDNNDVREIISGVSNGDAYVYDLQFTWGNPTRCTDITVLVGTSPLSGSDLLIEDVDDIIPGYPGDPDKECEAGTQCTVLSVEGYNKACGNISEYGTIQREVLLQL